jgi:hypothetical protein
MTKLQAMAQDMLPGRCGASRDGAIVDDRPMTIDDRETIILFALPIHSFGTGSGLIVVLQVYQGQG